MPMGKLTGLTSFPTALKASDDYRISMDLYAREDIAEALQIYVLTIVQPNNRRLI